MQTTPIALQETRILMQATRIFMQTIRITMQAHITILQMPNQFLSAASAPLRAKQNRLLPHLQAYITILQTDN